MRNALRSINPVAWITAGGIIAGAVVAGIAIGTTDNPLCDLIVELPARILAVIA